MAKRLNSKIAEIPPHARNPLNHAVSQRDNSTLQMVQDALNHNQAILAFQPVVIAHEQQNVAFYEGLIRVLDETGRVIPAADFMPVIEDRELGRLIDVQALRLGLLTLHHNPALRLSINMSARSIGYRAWTETLQASLNSDKTIGERLILEITESSAMLVPELVTEFMDEMQTHGICFAMDDFGAGFTAIRYFKEFFFDVMKIDGQFIRGIARDADNRAIAAALLSIAKQFDMLTVAESVENAEDAAVLTELGIDCLQGYYFGVPTTQPVWTQKTKKRRG